MLDKADAFVYTFGNYSAHPETKSPFSQISDFGSWIFNLQSIICNQKSKIQNLKSKICNHFAGVLFMVSVLRTQTELSLKGQPAPLPLKRSSARLLPFCITALSNHALHRAIVMPSGTAMQGRVFLLLFLPSVILMPAFRQKNPTVPLRTGPGQSRRKLKFAATFDNSPISKEG